MFSNQRVIYWMLNRFALNNKQAVCYWITMLNTNRYIKKVRQQVGYNNTMAVLIVLRNWNFINFPVEMFDSLFSNTYLACKTTF